MTKEKISWLIATLCCLYFIYSLLLTFLLQYSSSNFPSVHFVIVLLSSIIAVTLFKKISIGIKLSITFSILIIAFTVILFILNNIGFNIKFFYDDNTELSILMCVAIVPSCIISIYLKDKVHEFSYERFNHSINLTKSIGIKILSIIYFTSILSLIVLSVFGLEQNTNTIYLFNIILVIFYGVMFFVGNEVARKIAVVFPFVFLFYGITYILIFWDWLTDGFLGAAPLYISSIYGLGIFIILFLLSLPHYKWKKKIKIVETGTDIVVKNNIGND